MERGIIMNEWSMKAYFSGHKTQTRRLKGLKEMNKFPDSWKVKGISHIKDGTYFHIESRHGVVPTVRAPYGWIGDRLYFKESYALVDDGEKEGLLFKADGADVLDKTVGEHWVPAMLMKKGYARVNVPIVDVRLARLQELTEHDAICEGVRETAYQGLDQDTGEKIWVKQNDANFVMGLGDTYVMGYAAVWDAINAKTGMTWDFNPWVWVFQFPQFGGE